MEEIEGKAIIRKIKTGGDAHNGIKHKVVKELKAVDLCTGPQIDLNTIRCKCSVSDTKGLFFCINFLTIENNTSIEG